jgi:hypothetical protein
VLRLEQLERRDTPALIEPGQFAVGADAGSEPEVRVLDKNGELHAAFLAYESRFRGGVRVAVGDVNGDRVLDIVTGPGAGGGPHVKVFDGVTGQPTLSFYAFDPSYEGGVNVGTGYIQGKSVIVAGAGYGGGPQVNVFDGQTGELLYGFFAYDPAFRGGVTVAVGDLYGDGRGAIVTGAGPGGGPHVKVFDGPTGQPKDSFFAFEPTFHGGVTVAAGDVVGLGRDQVIVGAGFRGGPQVTAYDAVTREIVNSFFAYDPSFRGGVGVSVIPGGGEDGKDLLVTVPGPSGGPDVRLVQYVPVYGYPYPYSTAIVNNFFAYPIGYTFGLAFGAGFGLWRPYFPTFGMYYPGYVDYIPTSAPYDFAYDQYWVDVPPPVYIEPDPLFVDPGYYNDPYGVVDFYDPVFADPGYYSDGGYSFDDYYYFDNGSYYDYGYFDDYYFSDYSYSDYSGGWGDYWYW